MSKIYNQTFKEHIEATVNDCLKELQYENDIKYADVPFDMGVKLENAIDKVASVATEILNCQIMNCVNIDGFYRTTIELKNNEPRYNAALNFIATTLFNGLEELNGFEGLGKWALSVFDRYKENSFEMVIEIIDGNIKNAWYVAENNHILKIEV